MNLLKRLYYWRFRPQQVCQNCNSSNNEKGMKINNYWYIFVNEIESLKNGISKNSVFGIKM